MDTELVAAPSIEADSLLDHMCRLDFDSPNKFRRLTGLICTISRRSQDLDVLMSMMEAGMNIVRLNFSHDSHDFHEKTIALVQEAEKLVTQKLGYHRHVGIALDTKGPEIRTGLLEGKDNEIELKKNDNIRLSINKDLMDKCNRECIFVDYPNIINVVEPGNLVYLNDGAITLVIKEVAVDCLICQIEVGGMLGSRKSVSLPNIPVDLPPVSEKDRYDLKFGVEHNVDMVFASQIRTPGAIKEIRSVLGAKGKDIKIIAKIENKQCLLKLDEIIAASDGIIMARADLGVELTAEKVFLVQKAVIARCNRVGKPVICATQLLESMRYKTRPTRAEVADLGNAILDGADCVMLSSESAIGGYVSEAVKSMADICREAEGAIWSRHLFQDLILRNPALIDAAHSIAIAAVDAAQKTAAAAIVVLTTSGRSAYLISKYRPRCPILAVTRCPRSARQSHLYRGIIPLLYNEQTNEDWITETDYRIQYALITGKKMGFISFGDTIIVVSSWKDGAGFTNNLRIVYAFFELESFECMFKKDIKMTPKPLHT